jgi:uncharacterized membrane protein YoaK (UPF0700 family)
LNLVDGNYTSCVRLASMILLYAAGSGYFNWIQQTRKQATKDRSNNPSPAVAAQSASLLTSIAPRALVLFVLADILSARCSHKLFLPTVSLAFGLVNAAAQDTTGIVTNAVTGHIQKIGIGAVAAWQGQDKQNLNYQSLYFCTLFCASLIVGSIVREQQWIALPLGTSFGVIYASLFVWYGGGCTIKQLLYSLDKIRSSLASRLRVHVRDRRKRRGVPL